MLFENTDQKIQDQVLARQLCEKLRSGDRNCLDRLFRDYHAFFLNFARRRLFNSDTREDVVQSFWEELMNAKAICVYAQGSENSASLQTYLLGILYFRIIDANRKNAKNREFSGLEGNVLETKKQKNISHDEGLVTLTSEILVRNLVNEALLKLSENFPQDASLVKMHLDGLTYSQMAGKLGKNIDAIKKQFTREQTGSLVKFKKAFISVMHSHGLKFEDF